MLTEDSDRQWLSPPILQPGQEEIGCVPRIIQPTAAGRRRDPTTTVRDIPAVFYRDGTMQSEPRVTATRSPNRPLELATGFEPPIMCRPKKLRQLPEHRINATH